MKNNITILIFLLLLTGCATRYQANSFFSVTGGYSEIKTNEDSFIVSFRGNGFTSGERALRFALLRASELSLEKGYPYFCVSFANDNTRSYSYANTYGNASGQANTHSYSNSSSTSVSGSYSSSTYINTITKPGVSLGIKCFKEKPVDLEVIDAAYFFENNRKG